MTQPELVTSIGNVLTRLSTLLTSSEITDDNVKFQQLYAQWKHLSDQQKQLVDAQLKTDTVALATYTGLIQAATRQLDVQIASMKHVDKIFTTIAQISASLDDVLKLA